MPYLAVERIGPDLVEAERNWVALGIIDAAVEGLDAAVLGQKMHVL
jgi:hypothetical protein